MFYQWLQLISMVFALALISLVFRERAYAQDVSPRIVSSVPPSGYIDPREDQDALTGELRGISTVEINFSEAVINVGGGSLTAGNFQINYYRDGAEITNADLQTGISPNVTLVSGSGSGPYALRFFTATPARCVDTHSS